MSHFLRIYLCCCCSSMVPGSRNPMWGEEFNFSVDELPVQVYIIIYSCYRQAFGHFFTSKQHYHRLLDLMYILLSFLRQTESFVGLPDA